MELNYLKTLLKQLSCTKKGFDNEHQT
jgi:hypothetical protein